MIIVYKVTVKNVGDVFLRHSVHLTVEILAVTSRPSKPKLFIFGLRYIVY